MKSGIPVRAFASLLGRQLWRHPFITFLTAAGVALGVAMVSAIDIAGASALDSFAFSAQSIRGAATHAITAQPDRIPWQVYADLRTRLGIRSSAPVITDLVTVAELNGVTMTLLGVDPVAEAPFRSFLGRTEGNAFGVEGVIEFMSTPFTLMVDQRTADSYNLTAGETLELIFEGKTQEFEIMAVVAGGDSESGVLPSNLLITDIRDAQDFLNRHEWLDRIDLFLNEDQAEAIVDSLKQDLPHFVLVEPASDSYESLRQLTGAFRLNLGALSLLAVVVGTFLIYNTLSFNVLKSRRTLGVLRALGMTRPQIFTLIMFEALLLGIVGSVLGILLGRELATSLVHLVNQAYSEIYSVQTLPEVAFTGNVIWKAALIGLGSALSGAGVPAFSASQVKVSLELQHKGAAPEADVPAVRNVWVGLLAILAGAILMLPVFPLPFTFGGIFAGLVGISFFVPVLLRLCLQVVLHLVRSEEMPFVKIALRQPLRRLGQTSVAVAALMMSLSVVIGIGSMVGSFRISVESWLEQVIIADIYLSPASIGSNHFLSPRQVQELRSWPNIAKFTTIFETQARSLELGILDLVILSDDDAKGSRIYTQQIFTSTNAWDESIEIRGLVINEPMALKHGIQSGDSLTLVTDKSVTEFPVAGVFKSYDAVATVLMDEEVYLLNWDDAGTSGAGVTIPTGTATSQVIADLEDYFKREGIQTSLISNRELRLNALELFDRTFAVTGTLQILAIGVSFMSVLASLMGMMLDQAAEFNTMRAIGVTKRQMSKLLLMESGLFGLNATLLAIPVGLVLSLILIYVINVRSFGWSLEWTWQPLEIVKAAAVAASASLLASIYPIWRINSNLPGNSVQ